jgi:hypothetical protein
MLNNIQSEIALAVRSRIIQEIEGANESNVWIDDAPLPFGNDPPPFQNCFSVCVDDGNFDADWGGSTCALKEHSGVFITHMQKPQLDDSKKLTHATALNMLMVKKQILAAMLIDRTPGISTKLPWRPIGESGRPLWDQIRPSLAISPKRQQNWPLLYQYIKFDFTFFWDL